MAESVGLQAEGLKDVGFRLKNSRIWVRVWGLRFKDLGLGIKV